MDYKYRVKGVVEKPFILRGVFFGIGSTIDFHIAERELNFLKERCKITQLLDLKNTIETPNPIQNTTQVKAKTTQKAVKNELPKQSSGTNKVENIHKV